MRAVSREVLMKLMRNLSSEITLLNYCHISQGQLVNHVQMLSVFLLNWSHYIHILDIECITAFANINTMLSWMLARNHERSTLPLLFHEINRVARSKSLLRPKSVILRKYLQSKYLELINLWQCVAWQTQVDWCVNNTVTCMNRGIRNCSG